MQSTVSNCISHERCPSCARRGRDRSQNNLGVYDDGHKYCYSCGYYSPSNRLRFSSDVEIHETQVGGAGGDLHHATKPVAGSKRGSVSDAQIRLPNDCIPATESHRSIKWLEQYQLTNREIADNLLLFSAKGTYLSKKKEEIDNLLIFPVYGAGDDLLLWNGRNLDYEADGGTKWVIRGTPRKVIHKIAPEAPSHVCCVCEDLVSGIKLGRIVPTYPLFGKNISELLLRYLCTNYTTLLIYLDYDAIDTMVYLKQKTEPYFESVRIVISEHDPKYYDTKQLQEIIN